MADYQLKQKVQVRLIEAGDNSRSSLSGRAVVTLGVQKDGRTTIRPVKSTVSIRDWFKETQYIESTMVSPDGHCLCQVRPVVSHREQPDIPRGPRR